MAPRKRTQTAKNKKNPKAAKLDAFLQDFDDEVHTIAERLKEKMNNLLKDADNLYKTALIKLPMAVRKMNWIEYCNTEKPKSPVDESKVKEDAAQVELAFSTFSAKDTKNDATSADENSAPQKSAVKKKKAPRKAPSTSKKARALSVSKQGSTIRRSTRKPLITPARGFMDSSIIGSTPLVTPRFDPRLPNTPALRAARHRERVFSLSVNGSPISSAAEDIVISVPIGNGESLQLLASELNSVDLSQLDHHALRRIRNLQNRLTTLCGPSK